MYSRPADEILNEIRTLGENGYREIVLTGIHLGHYGVDFNQGLPRNDWTRLSTLLRDAMKMDGDFRLRMSSIEATEVTRDLVDVMAENPDRICPHLHVCVQSGSDSVLRRMKRRWSARQIVDRCLHVAERLSRPAFSTDVIVGFPGETHEEFEQTLDVCREIGFSKIHVFPFSRRKGTPAAEMPDQVDPQVRKARCETLTGLETDLRQSYFASLIGTRLRVLVEKHNPGEMAAGTSCRFAECQVHGSDGQTESLVGEFVDVCVTDSDGQKLLGNPIAE
jgi:threonylcarbamoyladenosine tRNA methylthiotransferase MtaB